MSKKLITIDGKKYLVDSETKKAEEVEVEGAPEVTPEVKPEEIPEVKPEVKPEEVPEVKPEPIQEVPREPEVDSKDLTVDERLERIEIANVRGGNGERYNSCNEYKS